MSGSGLQLSQSPFIANLGAGERSLWRFLVTLVAGLVAFVAAALAVVALTMALFVLVAGWPAPTSPAGLAALLHRFRGLAFSSGQSFDDAMQILALGIPSNVAPMFAFVGVAALVSGAPFKAFVTAAPRFRWRMALAGVLLSLAVIAPFVVLGQWLDPKAPPPPILSISADTGRRALYALVCIVAFAPAALGEEVLFRGWMLRQLSVLTRNPIALMVVDGAIFSAAHLQFAPDAFLARWIMGAGLTYMALRLGGIELGFGVHAANNIFIVLFIEPLTLKPPPNTGLSAENVLPYVGLLVAYVAMAEITARWGPLRRWSGADRTTALRPATAAAEHVS